jgi:hypothetical protein
MPTPNNPYDDILNQEELDFEAAKPEAAVPVNPYDSIVEAESFDAEQRTAASIAQAVETTPDKTAAMRKLAKDLGMAPAVLEYADPATTRQLAATNEIKKNTSDAQALANLFADPEFAKLALDDSEQLSSIERFLSDIGGKGIERGILQDRVGNPAFKMLLGGTLTAKEQLQFDELQYRMALNQNRGAGNGPPVHWADRALRGASWLMNTVSYTGTQIFTALPTAGGAAAIGAGAGAGVGAGGALVAGQLGPQAAAPEEVVTVPVAALAGALRGGRYGYVTGQTFYNFKQEAGFAYLEYKDYRDANGQLLDPNIARGAAIVAGAANASLETVADITTAKFVVPGVDKLLSKPGAEVVRKLLLNPESRDAMAELGKKALKASGTEGATELLQEAVTILGGEAAKAISPGEFESITPEEAIARGAESAISGAVGGAGVTIIGAPPASYITDRTMELVFGKQQEEVATAKGELDKVQAALDATNKSKLAARAPDVLQQFVDEATADSPLSSVYVSADSFAQLAEENGLDPADLAREFGIEAQLPDALGTGSDVEISMGAFLSTLANNDLAGPMMEIVKTNPFLPSRSEMKAMTDAGQEALIAQAENLAHKISKDAALGEEVKAIKLDVAAQMKAAGRFDARTNAMYASATAQFYAVMASRFNVTPAQMYEQVPLDVAGTPDTTAGADTYKQFVGQNSQDPAVQERFTRALEMASAGATREEIWQETMTYLGLDNKWRAEVSDENSRLTAVAEQLLDTATLPQEVHGRLDTLFTSPGMELSYPGFNRYIMGEIARRPGLVSGFVEYSATTGDPRKARVEGETNEDIREALVHEVQHIAQKLAGHQRGGNWRDIRRYADRDGWKPYLVRELTKILADINAFREIQRETILNGGIDMDSGQTASLSDDPYQKDYGPLVWEDLPERAKTYLRDQAAKEVYALLVGEVEARNSADRRDMTEEERRAKPPWESQDRPNERQILRQDVQSFAEWFQGSVVVDADGFPLRVYRGQHGNAENLETKLPSITFTETPETAGVYATDPNDHRDTPQAPKSLPAFLSIKNPIINAPDPFAEFGDLAQKLGREVAMRFALKYAQSIEATGNWGDIEERLKEIGQGVDGVKEGLEADPELLDELYMDAYLLLDDPEFVEAAKAAGFDGAVHYGNGESASEKEYRIFDRDQARSSISELSLAQGRRGEYLPNIAQIRLTPNANFSTYIHELGHHILESYLRLADELIARQGLGEALTAEQQQLINDVRSLVKHLVKQTGTGEASFQEIRDGAALTAEERRVLLEDPGTEEDGYGQAFTAPGKRPSGIDDRAPRGTATFYDERLGPVGSNFNKVVEMALNGYSNAEIAEELGLKKNSVKVYLSRARKEFGINIPKGFTPAGKLRTETGTMEDVLAAKKRGSDVEQMSKQFGKSKSRLRQMLSLARRKWSSDPNNGPLPKWLATNHGFTLYQDVAPIFYSRLRRALDDNKLTVAPGKDWLGALRNAAGVKADELAWTGLEEMLQLHEGKVTKEEIQAYLDAKGLIVQDVEYSGEDVRYPDMTLKGGEEYKELLLVMPPSGDTRRTRGRIVYRGEDLKNEVLDDVLDDFLMGMQDAGLEHLDYGRVDEGEGAEPYIEFSGFSAADMAKLDALAERMQLDYTFRMTEGKSDVYTNGHYPVENILAHVRFKIRTTPDGRTVLALEEIQSDWHQQGRKRGYREKSSAELDAEVARTSRVVAALNAQLAAQFPGENPYNAVHRASRSGNAAATKLVEDLAAAADAMNEAMSESARQGVKVPNAPFKATPAWTELVLKRMIRYAAEQGVDEIAWIPGYIQNGKMAPRGDNRSAFYDTIVVNTANKLGKKYGAKVRKLNVGVERKSRHVVTLENELARQETYLDDERVRLDVANQMLARRTEADFDYLVRLQQVRQYQRDVEIREQQIASVREMLKDVATTKDWVVYGNAAGERMLGSFDTEEAAVAFARELQLNPADVVQHEPQDVSFHALPITDDMRAAALTEGFPLFQNAPVFYSALSRAVQRSGPAKAPADQWKGILRNAPGAKQEELDWTLVNEWLDAQEGPVTKDALLEYLDSNGVKVSVLSNMQEPTQYDAADGVEGGADVLDYHSWYEENQGAIYERESELRYEAAKASFNRPDWYVEAVNAKPTREGADALAKRIEEADREIERRLNATDPLAPAETTIALRDRLRAQLDKMETALARDDKTPDMFGASPAPETFWIIRDDQDDSLVDTDGNSGSIFADEMSDPDTGYSRQYLIDNGYAFSSEARAERALEQREERLFDRHVESYEGDDQYFLRAEDEIMSEQGVDFSGNTTTFRDEGVVKWKQYTLAGGSQYREILLTLPTDKIGARAAPESFSRSHWPNVPNLLAHVRVTTRLRDGKLVLFIEEMQSDWHQQGRDTGYGRLTREERMAKERELRGLELDIKYILDNADMAFNRGETTRERYEAERGRVGGLERERVALVKELSNDRVPDAPFKNNAWASLAMKRMVRWAAENGFDEVAWTPAQVHIDRWSRYAQPEGMKLFYDKILPQAATAIGKKYNSKPGVVDMKFGGTRMQVLSLPLTEELKTAALEEGFPLFQQSPGFYSQLLRVVENSSTKSATAEQWLATMRNAPGVKTEEILWTGVEDWLASKAEAPGANRAEPITREDLADYLSNNGVTVETIVADKEAPEEGSGTLDWSEGEVWDDSEAWEHDVEYYRDEVISQDLENYAPSATYEDWKRTAAEAMAEADADRYKEILGEDYTPEAAAEYVYENEDLDADILELAESWIEDTAERYARDAYYENPMYIYETDPSTGPTMYIFGNDDSGYDIRIGANRWQDSIFNANRDNPGIYSVNEAQVQALEYAINRGWLGGEDGGEEAGRGEFYKWDQYVMRGRHTRYRELKLTLPNNPSSPFNYDSHFEDENIVAFLRVNDRVLAPGVSTVTMKGEIRLFLDESNNVVVTDQTGAVLTMFPARNGVDVDSAQAQLQRGLAKAGAVLVRTNEVMVTSNGDGTVQIAKSAAAKDTFFIDEFQSDWHQQGRKFIYDTPEEKARAEAMRTELSAQHDAVVEEMRKLAPLTDQYVMDDQIAIALWYVRVAGGGYQIASNGGYTINAILKLAEGGEYSDLSSAEQTSLGTYARRAYHVAMRHYQTREGHALSDADAEDMPAGLTAQAKLDAALLDKQKAILDKLDKVERGLRRPIPDAPFKGDAWISLGLKEALLTAVNEGKTQFAWANSKVLKNRWSERYAELYENLYDKKMVKIVEKLTGVKPVLVNVTAAQEGARPDEEGYWIIEIPDALAQKIKNDGFALFQEGKEPTKAPPLPEGMDPVQWFNNLNFTQKVAMHEQFARLTEAYMLEGKAPSPELQGMFSSIRRMLLNVYQSTKDLDVDLNPEVKEIMDRMWAAHQDVSTANDNRALGALFQVKPSFMSDLEWDVYLRLAENAVDDAEEELTRRSLRDMKWLSNARSKAMKELQAQAKEQRKVVAAEVTREVNNEPVNLARNFFKKGLNPDGSPVEGPNKLSAPALAQAYPEGSGVDWQRLGYGRYGILGTEGLDPDTAAEILGYPSGDALVRDLLAAPEAAQKIRDETDTRMLERFGELATPQDMERAADEAVHSRLRSRVLAAEYAALAKATGKPDRLLSQAAQAAAKQLVGRLVASKLNPQKYIAAARRAGREAEAALRRGDLAAAASAKRDQILNFEIAREIQRVIKDRNSALNFFQRVITAKRDNVARTRNYDLVQAARAILSVYGLGRVKNEVPSYLDAIKAYDPTLYASLEPTLLGAMTTRDSLDTLTVDKLLGLRDVVKQLWDLSREEKRIEIEGQQLELQDVVDKLTKRLGDLGATGAGAPTEAATDWQKTLRKMSGAWAGMRRVEAWARLLDGNRSGWFTRYIFRPVSQAADRYRRDRNHYIVKFRELFTALEPGMKGGKINSPELNYTFKDKSELLHAILHTGNRSNMRKLLLGRGWAMDLGDGQLDTSRWDTFIRRMAKEGKLTKADFDFAQGVWDLLEETKPLAQEAHRKVFGRYFSEITADEVQTPFGTYRGGYVPAIYDDYYVQDASLRAEQDAIEASDSTMFPTPASGFTKGRVEYNQVLALDLRLLPQHIDKVLKFAHLAAPVRAVLRILRNKEFARVLESYDPVAQSDLLLPWLQRSARQIVETPTKGQGGKMVDGFFKAVRVRSGMGLMFANFVNVAQQVTGFSLAAVRVKPHYLAGALMHYMRDPKGIANAINQASPMMADRMDNQLSQMYGEIEKIIDRDNKYGQVKTWFQRHAYWFQSAVQNVMDIIIWKGAYDQAQREGMTENEAAREADSAVRQTQGSVLPEDISRVESGSAFFRSFVHMYTYFNMWANLLSTEFRHILREFGLRKGAGRLFFLYVMGFAIPALFAELIAQGLRGQLPDDEDDDGYWDEYLQWSIAAQAKTATAFVPVAGQALNATMGAFNNLPYDDRVGASPAIGAIEATVRTPADLYKLAQGEGDASRTAKDVLTMMTLFTGLPFTSLGRPVGYALDVAEGDITPTSDLDYARGLLTGSASEASR